MLPRIAVVLHRNRRHVATTPIEAWLAERSVLTTAHQAVASPKAMPNRLLLLGAQWDSQDESAVIEDVYRAMAKHNFSSQLLQRLPDQIAVMELSDVLWSDWGKPERIAETIRRIGKIPAFLLECLDRPYTPHPVPQQAAGVFTFI